jgi:energy-coupling factor transporter ATP-binding protein EcfA2
MDVNLKGYEEKAGEWYSGLGWKGNPLDAKTIMPDLIVGLEKERKFLLQYIVNGGGYVLIKGPVGAGKTTLCRWLEGEMKLNPKYASIFFEEPPRNSKDVDYRIISALEQRSPFSNLRRLLGQKPPEFVTPEFLSDKLEKNGRVAVVFLDEAHIFESPEIAYRIKDIVDMNVNCRLIISGIQTQETDVEGLLPDAIVNRVSPVNRLILANLSRDDAKQLVLKRIESFGGKGFSPFDERAIETACNIFGGAPRSFLLFLSYCVDCAIEDELSEVRGEHIMKYAERYGVLPTAGKKEEKVESSMLDEFSDTQLQIMKSLSQKPMQTVKELASSLKINEEPARTQLKRINLKCRQMGIQDALGSRKDDARKSYVFWLNDHVARLFAKE